MDRNYESVFEQYYSVEDWDEFSEIFSVISFKIAPSCVQGWLLLVSCHDFARSLVILNRLNVRKIGLRTSMKLL